MSFLGCKEQIKWSLNELNIKKWWKWYWNLTFIYTITYRLCREVWHFLQELFWQPYSGLLVAEIDTQTSLPLHSHVQLVASEDKEKGSKKKTGGKVTIKSKTKKRLEQDIYFFIRKIYIPNCNLIFSSLSSLKALSISNSSLNFSSMVLSSSPLSSIVFRMSAYILFQWSLHM